MNRHRSNVALPNPSLSYVVDSLIWGKVIWKSKGSAFAQKPGGHLNKKDGLTRYGDSHVKDKTS